MMSTDLAVFVPTCMVNFHGAPLSLEFSHGLYPNKALIISCHVGHHSVTEKQAHLLKRKSGSLRHVLPEEKKRYDITANEDKITPLPNVLKILWNLGLCGDWWPRND